MVVPVYEISFYFPVVFSYIHCYVLALVNILIFCFSIPVANGLIFKASSGPASRNTCASRVVLDISPDVIAQCVALRKGKKIKTPDAIIAATALAYGFTLITNNEKDFANISGLKMVNPHKV